MRVSNIDLAIMVPCSFPFIPSSFFYSFVLMDKPSFTFIHADNGPIDTLRNDCIEKALSEGCTHGIFMDVDQTYPVNTIPKLLSHKLPIVGAAIPRRYPPFDNIILTKVNGGPTPYINTEYEDGELVSCDATGTGCIMYDLSIFKKLPYPWFKFKKNENGMPIGEDIGFCQDLRAAGYEIYVDTSIKIGHLANVIITEQFHKLYCGMQMAKEKKGEIFKMDNQENWTK